MFDPEILAKLSPEQLAVVKIWEKDRLKRLLFLDRMFAAKAANDIAAYDQAYKEYKFLNKDQCEHGRNIFSHCISCNEINEILSLEDVDDDD